LTKERNVSLDVASVLSFLDEQNRKQAAHFPTLQVDKVLSFMGTTSLPGSLCTVSVNPIHRIGGVSGAQELHVQLRGDLPREPANGECISVHVTHVDQYQGYQIKTRTLSGRETPAALFERDGNGVLVKGSHIFTVHQSPYTMKFFEQIPLDEVMETIGKVPCALVGVGETANISPRFVFHWAEQDGRPVLFHGDGLALKTYMNLKSNREESRTIIDLDTWSGIQLEGTCEEFLPHENPDAYERISRGFLAGGWGKPSRSFSFHARSWRKLDLVAALAG
jgi:hypothetical protein